MKQKLSGRRHRLFLSSAVLLTALATPGVALAAGSGYAPAPAAPTSGNGTYGAVLTAQSVPASGGTVTTTSHGVTYTVIVPSGAFSTSVQVVMTSPAVTPPPGSALVAEVGISVVQNGSPVVGAFAKPLTLTAAAPDITAASTVVTVSTSGAETPVNGVAATNGAVSLPVPADPTYAVLNGAAPIAGATTATTGKPFLLDGLLAAAFLGLGTLGIIRFRHSAKATA